MYKFFRFLFFPMTSTRAFLSWEGLGSHYIGAFRKELQALARDVSKDQEIFAYFNKVNGHVEFITSSGTVFADITSHGECGSPCYVIIYLNPKWEVDKKLFKRLAVNSLEEKNIVFTQKPITKEMPWGGWRTPLPQ